MLTWAFKFSVGIELYCLLRIMGSRGPLDEHVGNLWEEEFAKCIALALIVKRKLVDAIVSSLSG